MGHEYSLRAGSCSSSRIVPSLAASLIHRLLPDGIVQRGEFVLCSSYPEYSRRRIWGLGPAVFVDPDCVASRLRWWSSVHRAHWGYRKTAAVHLVPKLRNIYAG